MSKYEITIKNTETGKSETTDVFGLTDSMYDIFNPCITIDYASFDVDHRNVVTIDDYEASVDDEHDFIYDLLKRACDAYVGRKEQEVTA